MNNPYALSENKFKALLRRLGLIFFTISLLLLLVYAASSSSILFVAFIFLIAFIAIVFTLGLILVSDSSFFDNVVNLSQKSAEIATFFLQNTAYFTIPSSIFSVLSIIFLSIAFTKKHIANIVISSLIIIVNIVLTIVFKGA